MAEQFFSGTPEEMNEMLKQQAEQHEMLHQMIQHQVDRFIDDIGIKLGVDGLNTLRLMLSSFVQNSTAAAFYEGQVAAVLRTGYGFCISCGSQHGDPNVLIEADEAAEKKRALTDEELMAVAAEYRVNLLANGRVVCKNCGLEYVSLDDRMMKRPDECHGCFIKAGHG